MITHLEALFKVYIDIKMFLSLFFIHIFSSSENYLIGSENRLELHINVTNRGEDAYEASLLVSFPPNVHYIKTELLKTVSVIPAEESIDQNDSSSTTHRSKSQLSRTTSVLCSAPTPQNGHLLICDLGNPLVENSMVSKSIE